MQNLSLRSKKKQINPKQDPEEDLEDDVCIVPPEYGRAFRVLSHSDLEQMYYEAFLMYEAKPVLDALILEYQLQRFSGFV